jgi:LPS-assembly lipoprotein
VERGEKPVKSSRHLSVTPRAMKSDRRRAMGMLLRAAIALPLGAMVGACGFKLRGEVQLPFNSVYIAAPENSPVAAELSRLLRAGSKVRVADKAEDAEAVIQILGATQEKQILTLTRTGTVGEFLLRYRLNYRVFDRNKRELVPPTEILLLRDYSFNASEVLAKDTEEVLLYRDMQSDAVQQLVRRLEVLTPSKG